MDKNNNIFFPSLKFATTCKNSKLDLHYVVYGKIRVARKYMFKVSFLRVFTNVIVFMNNS